MLKKQEDTIMKAKEIPLVVDGHEWSEYTLTNDQGMSVSFLDFGGTITSIITPDQDKRFENVVLGFEDYKDYLNNPSKFGSLIGRVAGRIKDAKFTLNNTEYQLPKNEGEHHLHGGYIGLDSIVFQVELIKTETRSSAVLYHTSTDGEDGYPGTVRYKITYTLTNENEFTINYEAFSDQDTILTLTNHSYFNLSGDLKETVHDHELKMNASQFIELDEDLIATGNILPVLSTPFDFRNGRKIRDGIESSNPQIAIASGGYDHYFIFDQEEGQIKITDEKSGRILDVKTNQPGIVIYTANGFDDHPQKLKERYAERHLGFCLETQGAPASLEDPKFPSIYLKADEKYERTTSFTFSTINE